MKGWDRAFVDFRIVTATDEGRSFGEIAATAVGVVDGRIDWLGDASAPEVQTYRGELIEGGGQFLSPGLIDCHTHLVYGGSRADEWERRLNGETYEQIARSGGGILSTVRATRSATEEELYAAARSRVERLLREGVTTIEIKSGYGLDVETELKMLRVAGDLGRSMPVDVSRTLLAAHAIPPEFDGRSDDYVALVCNEIIPAAQSSCCAVDAFCESIAFSWPQCQRVFSAAQRHGLAIKIHAEQMTHTGSAAFAANMGAWSADHLEQITAADVASLARHRTVAVLLPGAYYFLRDTHPPPVESMRQHGARIAVATDCNPGSSPVRSLLLMMNMACTLFGLTPAEAWLGVTLNAARALRMDDRIGSIEVGKQADLVVWAIDSPAELAYNIGSNPCRQVYKRGELIINHGS